MMDIAPKSPNALGGHAYSPLWNWVAQGSLANDIETASRRIEENRLLSNSRWHLDDEEPCVTACFGRNFVRCGS